MLIHYHQVKKCLKFQELVKYKQACGLIYKRTTDQTPSYIQDLLQMEQIV